MPGDVGFSLIVSTWSSLARQKKFSWKFYKGASNHKDNFSNRLTQKQECILQNGHNRIKIPFLNPQDLTAEVPRHLPRPRFRQCPTNVNSPISHLTQPSLTPLLPYTPCLLPRNAKRLISTAGPCSLRRIFFSCSLCSVRLSRLRRTGPLYFRQLSCGR